MLETAPMLECPPMDEAALIRLGRKVLDIEARSVAALQDRLGDAFADACRVLLECRGHVVVIGMGKSGHIGSKIAATLASTGTPAFFMHPAEASHGDLGMITKEDCVLALSNSGETHEVNQLLPPLKRLGVGLVAMTGRPDSSLARHADVHLDSSVDEEACPLGLAPTSSTTATLALGDALAIALLEARGFTEEDFARSHPAGRLGRQLLLKVGDLMHQGEALPRVAPDTPLTDVLVEMTAKRLGMALVLKQDDQLAGVFTDGDVRRTIESGVSLSDTPVSQVMTESGHTIAASALAVEALQIMQEEKIQGLPVVNESGQVVGALNFQDLLQAGVA